MGFLPHKKGRQTMVKEIAASEHPVVIYESPHRVVKFLGELNAVAPEARVTIARELTKMFEEVLVGKPTVLAKQIEEEKKDRGEFVLIIEP
jgi:16S rRNA (cytidine1402-2'-O)-methyltransferase